MASVQRRYVEWRINIREDDYEVIRYENGRVIPVDVCAGRDAAWAAMEFDRATVLADPLSFESRPYEFHVR
jgi:hypothetical protein